MKIAKVRSRFTWQNNVKNQVIQPLKYFCPDSLEEIKQIITDAETLKIPVKAVGSGHSFSDIVQTTGYLVNTDLLYEVLPLEGHLLKENINTKYLVNVEGGIKIRNLNKYLDKNDMALPNMGGYDGQSITGASSTSTHGSGLQFGPITSFYRSVTIVAAQGAVYRIEPTNGITDPLKFKEEHPDIILKQDDQWFNTVAVSMGCTGIIYSVILEVGPKFWLEEKRYMATWEEVKQMLQEGKCLKENRHFEVLVNPYSLDGKRRCLITQRNEVTDLKKRRTRKKGRHPLNLYLGIMPFILKLIDYFFNHYFWLIPKMLDFILKGLVDKRYIDISYHVLNLGAANYLSAFSSELAFPLENHQYLDSVEKMFEIADKARQLGYIYHTSPISLRFVKAYGAYLSMMYGRDTCTVEMPIVNYTYGGYELLHLYENEIADLNGRIHWGQMNTVPTNPQNILKSYPEFNLWYDVYKVLNCKGTFNNEFTNRMGISIIEN